MNNNILIFGILGFGAWFAYNQQQSNIAIKKTNIINKINQGGDSQESKDEFKQLLDQISSREVTVLHKFIVENSRSREGLTESVKTELAVINAKYSLFT